MLSRFCIVIIFVVMTNYKTANSQLTELNAIGLPAQVGKMPLHPDRNGVGLNSGGNGLILWQLSIDVDFPSLSNGLDLYNPVTNLWDSISLPADIHKSVIATVDSSIYLLDPQSRFFWRRDSSSALWIQVSSFPGQSRNQTSMFQLKNIIYVLCGDDNSDCWSYDPLIDNWVQKNNFSGGPRKNINVWSLDSTVYAGLGWSDSTGTLMRDLWKYDDLNDAWIQKSDYPDSLYWTYIHFATNNRAYLHSLSSFREYDPFSDAWIVRTALSSIYDGIGFGAGPKGYIIQRDLSIPVNTRKQWHFDEYDPLSDTWINKFTYSGPLRNYENFIEGNAISFDHKAYIKNSIYDPSTDSWTLDTSTATWLFSCLNKGYALHNGNFEEYDPALNSWSLKAMPPFDLLLSKSLFEINGNAYVQALYALSSEMFSYDPVSDIWTSKGLLPLRQNQYSTHGTVAFAIGNKGYFGLGYDTLLCSTDSFFEYEPLSNSWTPKAKFPAGPRQEAFGLGGLHKGFVGLGVECQGAFNGDNPWIFIYDPTSDSWQVGGSVARRLNALSFIIDGLPYIGGGADYINQDFGMLDFSDFYLIDTAYFQTAHHINGRLFFDINNNGLYDSLETPLLFPLGLSPNNYFSFLVENGQYDFFVADGNYTISATAPAGFHISNIPASYNISLIDSDAVNISFGIYPDNPVLADLDPVIISRQPRCSTEVSYYVSCRNVGLNPANGILEFHPDSQMTFVSSIPAPDSIVNNIIYWNYSGINPFSNNLISTVNFLLPGAGNPLYSRIFISALDSVGTILDTASNFLSQIVTCSFDPNEKTVSPYNGEIVQPDSWLNYTLYFQNTGTDTAFTVVLLDTIDSSLDIGTIEVTGSSHSYLMNYANYNVIRFLFNDILLPDSNTNQISSQAYISYRIKVKNNISPGTEISNTATIYFDLNSGIATNTTTNYIQSITGKPFIEQGNVLIFPNPAHDYFKLQFSQDEKPFQLTMYDMMGRKIETDKSFESGERFNFHAPPGLYLIKIISGNKSMVKKLLVE